MMSVNIVGAQQSAPPAVPGLNAQPDGANLSTARTDKPDASLGVTAVLDAKAAAGMELAHKVLWFIAGAVFLLLVFLTIFEFKDLNVQWTVDERVLHQVSAGGAFPDPARIEKWAEAWRSGSPPTSGQLAEWRSLADLLRRGGGLSERQIDALKPCANPPKTPAITSASTSAPGTTLVATGTTQQLRQPGVIAAACADLLDMIDSEAMSAATSLEKDKLLTDFAKDVDAQHQTFRTFFMQLAQMLLLNLLLPVLTALLGYIFGTQQAQQKP
jgi:hypothetical protein